ncbi:MAG: diguanylate cyclase [Desulfocapsaceae bacterium]|nr:diguanylate cyclase [Desulfocapsaceae bacterium]
MNLIHNGSKLEEVLVEKSVGEIVAEFLRLFLFVLFLVLSCILFFLHTGYQNFYVLKIKNEIDQLELVKFSMTRDLEVLVADLHVLVNSETLRNYVDSPTHVALASLENRLAIFSADRKIYDQIRYLNRDGEEIVRINYNSGEPFIVLRSQLQNKKDRYYFQNTINKKSGEVYLSPLDLNVEQGKVETPYKPVLRLAAPVFDINRNVAGMVVLNYRAGLMLERFATSSSANPQFEYFLINQDGYWLKCKDSSQEWGFVLNHGMSFASYNPEVWNAAKAKSSGQIKVEAGIYLHTKITPLEVLGLENAAGSNPTDSEEWLLFAHIPAKSVGYLQYIKRYQSVFLVLLCFMGLLGIGCWQIAVARITRKRSENSFRLLSRGLSQSPAAVVITDKVGDIRYVNPSFEKLTGFSSEEVLGKNPRIFKSGKTSNIVYAELWKTINNGETWVGDFENKDKSNRPYFVSAQISPILNEKGQIEHFIGIQEDVTEKVAMQRKLEKLATTDSLTGAINRGHFMAKCKLEGKRLVRYNGNLSLLLFDLDNFKDINDTYGHLCGDRVLKHFVENVNKSLRESDILGRIGGEEFAALVVETEKVGALLLAERLRQNIEELHVVYDTQKISYTVSIGVTQWLESDENIEALFKRADDALYLAKKYGRNRVEFL